VRSGISGTFVFDRLDRIEERLEQLIAAGWRNETGDRAALAAELARIEDWGLTELGARIRALLDSPSDALLATTASTLVACRLLRARLVDLEPPPGSWEPLSSGRQRPARASGRLVPIGRVDLRDREAWACARFRQWAVDWILIAPLPALTRGVPWLTFVQSARVTWAGRYPVGASSDVQLVEVSDLTPIPPPADGAPDLLVAFRESLRANELEDGQLILPPARRLQFKRLDRAGADSCAWPSPAMAEAFISAASKPVWTIAIVSETEAVTPLVVLAEGRRRARLVHLVRGNPGDNVEG
jgi:hypothetical protein